MRTGHRLARACLLASVLLIGLAASTASANRISITERSFRATWAPLTAYFFEAGSVPFTVECNVTMEGSFHSASIRKVVGALIGYITRASLETASCRNGTVALLTATLPWHIRYDSFTGVLPVITGMNVQFVGLAFSEHIGERESPITCLARSTAANPMKERIEIERTLLRITIMRSNEEIRIPATGFPCETGTMSYEGTATMTALGTTRSIFVRLI